MKKYNADVEKDGKKLGLEVFAPNLKEAKECLVRDGFILKTIASANCSHFCKYCGALVLNDFEDLLCDKCREVFGHALYSEL